MEKFKTIDEVLDFAMEAEQEAVDFYTQLAGQMNNEEMKKTFLEFAREEISHKARLQKVKDEKLFDLHQEQVPDLKISDYVVSVKPSADMKYDEALRLAIKKEKAAFKLYTTLAARSNDPGLKAVFENLAVEESKHKLRFEIEYDEFVLREN